MSLDVLPVGQIHALGASITSTSLPVMEARGVRACRSTYEAEGGGAIRDTGSDAR